MSGSEERCTVCVRVRPLNEREEEEGANKSWRVLSEHDAVQQLDADGNAIANDKSTVFHYDHVFDEDTATDEVFRRMGSGLVDEVLRGVNGTIFAYGQTSSGKTFTMQNASEGRDMGLVQCATDHIFSHVASTPDRHFCIRVSFLEVYNEQLFDLLHPTKDKSVRIHEDPAKGVYVRSKERFIGSKADIFEALAFGQSRRAVAATKMNERSSRSHTIFRITIESQQQEAAGALDRPVVATLNLVDLAGSESARLTGATGKTLKEGGNINKSLTSLSRVIQILGSGNPKLMVPFRESKLTRMLQPSLSGNARIAIVCCITPSGRYTEETRSTLQFGSRAKLVKTNATINEVVDEASELRRIKKALKASEEQVASLRGEVQSLAEEKAKNEGRISTMTNLFFANDAVDLKKSRRKMRETWCPGDAKAALAAAEAEDSLSSEDCSRESAASAASQRSCAEDPQEIFAAERDRFLRAKCIALEQEAERLRERAGPEAVQSLVEQLAEAEAGARTNEEMLDAVAAQLADAEQRANEDEDMIEALLADQQRALDARDAALRRLEREAVEADIAERTAAAARSANERRGKIAAAAAAEAAAALEAAALEEYAAHFERQAAEDDERRAAEDAMLALAAEAAEKEAQARDLRERLAEAEQRLSALEAQKGTPEGTEEGAEQGTEEGAEQGTEEGAEQGTEEGAPEGTEEDTEAPAAVAGAGPMVEMEDSEAPAGGSAADPREELLALRARCAQLEGEKRRADELAEERDEAQQMAQELSEQRDSLQAALDDALARADEGAAAAPGAGPAAGAPAAAAAAAMAPAAAAGGDATAALRAEVLELRSLMAAKDKRLEKLEKVRMTKDVIEKFQRIKEERDRFSRERRELRVSLDAAEARAAALQSAEAEGAAAGAREAEERLREARDEANGLREQLETALIKMRRFSARCQTLEREATHVRLFLSQRGALEDPSGGGDGAAAAEGGEEGGGADLEAVRRGLQALFEEGERKAGAARERERLVRVELEDVAARLEAEETRSAELLEKAEGLEAAVRDKEEERARALKFLEAENLELLLEMKNARREIAELQAEAETQRALRGDESLEGGHLPVAANASLSLVEEGDEENADESGVQHPEAAAEAAAGDAAPLGERDQNDASFQSAGPADGGALGAGKTRRGRRAAMLDVSDMEASLGLSEADAEGNPGECKQS